MAQMDRVGSRLLEQLAVADIGGVIVWRLEAALTNSRSSSAAVYLSLAVAVAVAASAAVAIAGKPLEGSLSLSSHPSSRSQTDSRWSDSRSHTSGSRDLLRTQSVALGSQHSLGEVWC